MKRTKNTISKLQVIEIQVRSFV